MQPEHKTKKPTLADIEALTGISKSTISRVLNNSKFVTPDITAKVMAAIEETGYKKNTPKLQTGITISRITLVVGDYVGLSTGFYSYLISHIKEEAQRIHLNVELLVLHDTQNAEAVASQVAGQEAILLLGLDAPTVLGVIQAQGIPAVIINGADLNMVSSCVSPDYTLGAMMATRHLIEAGHQDIRFITAGYRHSLFQRKAGFMRALELAGMGFDVSSQVLTLEDYARHQMHNEALAVEIEADRAGGDFGAAQVIPHALTHGALAGATALFCVSDMVAISVMDCLRQAGVDVPGSVSVVGFDDLAISSLTSPPLTTVRTDFAALTKSAVHLLVTETGQQHDFSVRLNTQVHFVARQSVKTLK